MHIIEQFTFVFCAAHDIVIVYAMPYHDWCDLSSSSSIAHHANAGFLPFKNIYIYIYIYNGELSRHNSLSTSVLPTLYLLILERQNKSNLNKKTISNSVLWLGSSHIFQRFWSFFETKVSSRCCLSLYQDMYLLLLNIHKPWNFELKIIGTFRYRNSKTSSVIITNMNILIPDKLKTHKADLKIYRGTPIKISEVPFLARLIEPDGGLWCGASIINEKYLLTAAHW